MSSEAPIFVSSRSSTPEPTITLPFEPIPTLGEVALEWSRFTEDLYSPEQVVRFIRSSGEILFHLMEEEMHLRDEVAAVCFTFLPTTFSLTVCL